MGSSPDPTKNCKVRIDIDYFARRCKARKIRRSESNDLPILNNREAGAWGLRVSVGVVVCGAVGGVGLGEKCMEGGGLSRILGCTWSGIRFFCDSSRGICRSWPASRNFHERGIRIR